MAGSSEENICKLKTWNFVPDIKTRPKNLNSTVIQLSLQLSESPQEKTEKIAHPKIQTAKIRVEWGQCFCSKHLCQGASKEGTRCSPGANLISILNLLTLSIEGQNHQMFLLLKCPKETRNAGHGSPLDHFPAWALSQPSTDGFCRSQSPAG